MYALKLASCKKILGQKTVFSGLNAELEGFILGIAGANGSGKSTLVKCLVGLLTLDEGLAEIRRTGEPRWAGDLEHSDELGRDRRADELGKDPEIITLTRGTFGVSAPWMNAYPELSVKENLTFLADLADLGALNDRAGQRESVDAASYTEPSGQTNSTPQNTFGLSRDDLTKPVGSLSSGQQQKARLMLAGAFDPEVLFLDEPDSHLDEESIEHLHAWIAERKNQSKLTIIASNQPRELALCDGVLTL
ncbi:MAG: ATP-binding cassette domain-containing protein [Balneolaceae bacterium]|nr:ATP-binding cassette domain-containing protein [Balneolaceae bacterium]